MPDKTFKELIKKWYKLYLVYVDEHNQARQFNEKTELFDDENIIKPRLMFDEWIDVCEEDNRTLIYY